MMRSPPSLGSCAGSSAVSDCAPPPLYVTVTSSKYVAHMLDGYVAARGLAIDGPGEVGVAPEGGWPAADMIRADGTESDTSMEPTGNGAPGVAAGGAATRVPRCRGGKGGGVADVDARERDVADMRAVH